jgi:hypothetical protein
MRFAPLSRLILRQDQKVFADDSRASVSRRDTAIFRNLFADRIAVTARGKLIRLCPELIRFLIEESGKFRVILEGVSNTNHFVPL